MENTFEENVRTKGQLMAEAIRDRTPIIEACLKVQMSEKLPKSQLKTEIVDRPCERIDGTDCAACAFPDKKWKLGKCNLATHLTYENKKGEKQFIVTPITMTVAEYEEEQRKVNPIKQSKRGF
jgi:hypothetical protein